jgi:hypothetical protein
MLDRPVSGRIFFEQVIRDNLDIGRPDQVGLVFARSIHTGRKRRTPGVFRTRIITDGVTPSLHVGYKSSTIRQYRKEGRALRTETTINNPDDFACGKRLHNLPTLCGRSASPPRRLLGVQRISHDPADGAAALAATCDPIIHDDGTRTAGLRLTDRRAQALLATLCIFRLLPAGFTNRDLRTHLAPLLGKHPEDMTAGQMTYDLRRLREHQLIRRIPHTRRYHVTDTGLHHALFLTRVHNRILYTGLAEITGPDPPRPSKLRSAAHTYQTAIDDLANRAGVAAPRPAETRPRSHT